MTRWPCWAFVLLTAFAGCKSTTQDRGSHTLDQREESLTAQRVTKGSEASMEGESTLTPAEEQRIWRCATQSGAMRRVGELTLEPATARAEIEDALRKSDDARERYSRLRMNWNTEWDPTGITDWGFGWGYRGFRVYGRARTVDDIAEFNQRMQTSERTPAITIDQLEAIADEDATGYRFALVESTASEVARGPGELAELLAEARTKGVDAVVERRCDFAPRGGTDASPDRLVDVDWRAHETRGDRLHRVRTWSASVSDARIDAVVQAASRFDGADFTPRGKDYDVTLYRITPRPDSDFAPPAVKGLDGASFEGEWSGQLTCDNPPLCGVSVESSEVRTRVEETVELIEQADRLHAMGANLAELKARRTPVHAVVSCLRKHSPVARPDNEVVSRAQHEKQQKEKPIHVRAFTARGGTIELRYNADSAPEDFDLATELQTCLEADEQVASATTEFVEASEPTLRVSVEPDVEASERGLPPWNSTGTKTARQIIEGFAGVHGEKWKTWLEERVRAHKRNLLIAYEGLPRSLEAPALLQRLGHTTKTAFATIDRLDYAYSVLQPEGIVRAHRFEVAVAGSPTTALAVVYYWGRMTRLLSLESLEYDPDAGKMTAQFDAFSFAESK